VGNGIFADRLKLYMESRNLSFRDMEKITGIPYQTLNRYALGHRSPKITLIPELARKMNVSDRWLMGLDEEQPTTTKDDELLTALHSNPTKLMLAEWICQLNQEQLQMVEGILQAVIGKSVE
jgi:transcriptional regulator with XRE-family HTH domain